MSQYQDYIRLHLMNPIPNVAFAVFQWLPPKAQIQTGIMVTWDCQRAQGSPGGCSAARCMRHESARCARVACSRTGHFTS